MTKEIAAIKIQAAWRGYSVRKDPNHIFEYPKFINNLLKSGFFKQKQEFNIDIRAWYTGNYDGKTDSVTLQRYICWYPYLNEMLKSQLPLIPRGIQKLIDTKTLSTINFIEDNYKLNIPSNHPFKEIWDLFCQRDKTGLYKYLTVHSDSTCANNPDELIIYWTTKQDLAIHGSWKDCDTLIEVTLPKHAAFRIENQGIDTFEQEWNTFGALPFRYISKIIRQEKLIYQKDTLQSADVAGVKPGHA